MYKADVQGIKMIDANIREPLEEFWVADVPAEGKIEVNGAENRDYHFAEEITYFDTMPHNSFFKKKNKSRRFRSLIFKALIGGVASAALMYILTTCAFSFAREKSATGGSNYRRRHLMGGKTNKKIRFSEMCTDGGKAENHIPAIIKGVESIQRIDQTREKDLFEMEDLKVNMQQYIDYKNEMANRLAAVIVDITNLKKEAELLKRRTIISNIREKEVLMLKLRSIDGLIAEDLKQKEALQRNITNANKQSLLIKNKINHLLHMDAEYTKHEVHILRELAKEINSQSMQNFMKNHGGAAKVDAAMVSELIPQFENRFNNQIDAEILQNKSLIVHVSKFIAFNS